MRLWKSELLVEEALGQNLVPVRPEVAAQQGRNYFKLPLDLEENQGFLLRTDRHLCLPVGEEERPFLGYLSAEDKKRKRYRQSVEHELWAGFPALYCKQRYGQASLTTLFRFNVPKVHYPDLGNHWKDHQLELEPLEIRLTQEEVSSIEAPYFLDELFLSERLGLLDEETRLLRHPKGSVDAGPKRVLVGLVDLLGTDEEPVDESTSWTDLIARLSELINRRCRSSQVQMFPYGLIFEQEQAQPTRNLQKDLDQILDDRMLDTLDSKSAASAYLFGSHQEEVTPVKPVTHLGVPLTPSQTEAFGAALSRRLTVISGPPGTGKTEVIKNLMAHRLVEFVNHLKSPDSLSFGLTHASLVCSTNNRAVDHVFEGMGTEGLLPAHIRLGSRLVLQRNTLGALVQYANQLGEADPVQGERDFRLHKEAFQDLITTQTESGQTDPELFLVARKLLDAYVRANQTQALDLVELLISDIEGKRGLGSLKKEENLDLFVSLFPLLGSTLLSLRNTFDLEPESIGMVLVDEAGQCAPPYVFPALMRARRAVVLGDSLQLEPVVRLHQAEVEGIRKSKSLKLEPEQAQFFSPVMERSNSAQKIAELACVQSFPLREHFRCRASIIQVCCDLCGYDLELSKDRMSLIGAPLGYLDLRGTEERYGGSWHNPLEVESLLALLERYHQKGFSWGDMAVLTPFRGQLVFINQALSRSHIPHFTGEGEATHPDSVVTGTVHRFQGAERPLVFFSQVIANGEPVFINSRVNLLNVAVSRAQDYFCYVGSMSSLDRGPFTKVLKTALLRDGQPEPSLSQSAAV